jgi:hypothetical protein
LCLPTHDPLSQPRLKAAVIGCLGRRNALVVHLGLFHWLAKADPRLGTKTPILADFVRPGLDIANFFLEQLIVGLPIAFVLSFAPFGLLLSVLIFTLGKISRVDMALWRVCYLLGCDATTKAKR